jgi:hypothetical protein
VVPDSEPFTGPSILATREELDECHDGFAARAAQNGAAQGVEITGLQIAFSQLGEDAGKHSSGCRVRWIGWRLCGKVSAEGSGFMNGGRPLTGIGPHSAPRHAEQDSQQKERADQEEWPAFHAMRGGG